MNRNTKWVAGSALATVVVGGGAGIATAAGGGSDEDSAGEGTDPR